MIRLAQPAIDEQDIAAVAAVLRSGWLVQGAEVRAFEAELARIAGVPHAVAVSNGTAALHLALLALGVGPGDEVAVAAYSWPATANAVVFCGARPVFVDIEPRTLGMDPDRLAEVLRGSARCRAVLPVDAFGRMADLPAISAAAEARGVPVVEDAACALGARLAGRAAGGWGAAGCFSFHPRKVVTTGEGGAVTTADGALADRVRALRNHGLAPRPGEPSFEAAGLNCRLTEFQGALGRVQLGKLPSLLATHRRIAGWYAELLAALPLTLPEAGPGEAHIYQSYVVLLPAELAGRRSALLERLRSAGVEATIGTHHIPLTTYYRREAGYQPGDFPVTDAIAARAVALPMHHALERDEAAQVAEALGESLRALAG
ncbi:MAG TPA: DegT/DnrJ/EryC1/StrS family aminotransferase [Gemmatimonadales bacterium]|nr:DegT/DnrJ/EryC1/StrS family aminotransferase [Gemmatimonadales bacterium]